MNLIFLLPREIEADGASAWLPPTDARFVHVLEVLAAATGQELRCAIVDGPLLRGVVEWVSRPLQAVIGLGEGASLRATLDGAAEARHTLLEQIAGAEAAGAAGLYVHIASRDTPGGLEPFALSLRGKGEQRRAILAPRRASRGDFGREVQGVDASARDEAILGLRLRLRLPASNGVPAAPLANAPALAPRVSIDLLLACPRPKVVERLLSSLATFGVRRVLLIRAEKTEATYFDGKRLSRANIDECLLDGLCQGACYTRRPAVDVQPRPGLSSVLSLLSPDGVRMVAHPGPDAPRLGALIRRAAAGAGVSTVTLAVGPEGGWTDGELDTLAGAGFGRVELGARILRTADAVISLLALLYDTVESSSGEELQACPADGGDTATAAAPAEGGGCGLM